MITIMITRTIAIKGKDKDNDKNTSELKKWLYKPLKFDHIWSFGGKFEFLFRLFIRLYNNSKVFMSAFKNLNALTCHNKMKYNDDTNSRLQN